MQQSNISPAAISLGDVARGVLHRKLFILGMTALAFGASLFYVNYAKPRYTSEAQVIVENLASPYDRVQGPEEQRSEPLDDRVIQSQVAILKSKDLALRVVKLLNLTQRAEFDGLKNGEIGLKTKVLVALGFTPDPRKLSPEDRAMSRYYDGLTVFQVPQSSVITVEFTGADPATAAELLNTLTSQYVAETAETRLKPTMRARDWLAQQIRDLRGKVSASEQAVEEYRSKAGLLKGETSTLNNQELSELNRQITAAESTRADAEERAKSIRNMLNDKGAVDDSVDVLNSPIIQRLREQQASSARKVAELSATYLSSHPKMIAAQNDLRNIERQLRREALKIVDSLQEQARVAAGRQAALSQRLQQIKNVASNANLDEVKLKELERNAAADRALLESLMLRYADASARQDAASQPAMARIIQQAAVPYMPSFPRKGPMVLLISLAAFLLSLGISFLLEIMAAASRATGALASAQSAPNEVAVQPVKKQVVAAVREEPRLTEGELPPDPEEEEISARVAAATGADFPARQKSVAPSMPEDAARAPVANLRNNSPLAIFSLANSVTSNQELLRTAAKALTPLQIAASSVADWIVTTMDRDKLKRFAIVSVGTGGMSSSVSTVAIARAVSARNKRVVMLDLSPSDVGTHTLAGLSSGSGLVDLLTGKADFTGIVARDTTSSAHIIRFGHTADPAAIALLSSKLDQILQTLNGIYDAVFVNAGELSSGAQIMAGRVQAALLLAPAVRQREVAAAVQALKASGMNAVEFVALVQGAEADSPIRASA